MITLSPRLQSFLNQRNLKHYIDGAYVKSSHEALIAVINPATEEKIASVSLGSREDVDIAVRSAKEAFHYSSPWRTMTPDERSVILIKLSELLETHVEALGQLVTLENGKLFKEAKSSDVMGAAKTFRYYAGWCSKIEGETIDLSQKQKEGKQNFAFTRREPIGVVAAIIPWNFPLSIASWKVAPALAAGCTVVLKPSEETPLSALLLAELATEAGLPPGVLNVVTGDGVMTGSSLVSHPSISKVTFTGSTVTGKIIGKSAMDHVTSVSLELGGKSPAIVCQDADIKKAAQGVAAGIFRNQGQVCVAGSRAYIHESIFEQVTQEICRIAEGIKISDGFDESAEIGPLVSQQHRDKVCDFINKGLKDGATLLTGGSTHGEQGYYLKPTVFSVAHHDVTTLIQDEIFGPVLVAVPFTDIEDAIAKANDSTMGLAATIWTQDLSTSMQLLNRIEAGLIYVNSPVRSDPNLPLGGFKHSGIGSELGKNGLYAYTKLKAVNIVY